MGIGRTNALSGSLGGGKPDAIFGNNTWEKISKIAKKGDGANYWQVGDMKQIVLNGNIGTLNLSNYITNVFILDFNHSDNGVADNNIILGGFITNNKKVTLANNYDAESTNGTKYFNMNHWGKSNYGGWGGCDLRYDILGATSTPPSGYGSAKTTSTVGYNATMATITSPVANTLMAALPADFRNILKLRTHYVDNTGGYNMTYGQSNVTAITDAGIFLLTEYEIFGATSLANPGEASKQTQMAYFAQGGEQVYYRHDSLNAVAQTAFASPYVTHTDAGYFTAMHQNPVTHTGASAAKTRGMVIGFII